MVAISPVQSVASTPFVEAFFYRDLLCARCHLAALRLERARQMVGAFFSWRIRPYPLGASCTSSFESLRNEPDAPPLREEVLARVSPDGAGSIAMVAVEAASFQSARAGRILDCALREAAFGRGLDVGDADVVMAVAGRVAGAGLDLVRLRKDVAGAPEKEWRDRLVDRRNDACIKGVDQAPALLIGERKVCGLRPVDEYVEVIVEVLAGSVVREVNAPLA